MSHVVTIDFPVDDLECLEKAAVACGLVFNRDQKTHRWFGRWVGDYPLPAGVSISELGRCDHALSVKDNTRAYEIGVVRNENGGYKLMYDFFARGYGLLDRVGPDANILRQEYSLAVAQKDFEQQGYRVWTELDKETNRRMVIAETGR